MEWAADFMIRYVLAPFGNVAGEREETSETESSERIPNASDSLKNKLRKVHCKVQDELDQEKQQLEDSTTRSDPRGVPPGGTGGGDCRKQTDQDRAKDRAEQARRT